MCVRSVWPLKRPAVAEHVNSEVQLTCVVTDDAGWTNYTVLWYKDGNQVGGGGSGKYSVEQTASGSVLTVRRVREYDVGPYECAVTLGSGLARKTFSQVVNLFGTVNSVYCVICGLLSPTRLLPGVMFSICMYVYVQDEFKSSRLIWMRLVI